MNFIVRELREMNDAMIGSISRRRRCWRRQKLSHIAPDVSPCEFECESEPEPELVDKGQWANLPTELLSDIISRVEESEASWPARNAVVSCASVCKSWRDITKEIVKTPEQCGRLTFPISLKQPGSRDSPIQCFIKRDRTASIYRLYLGLTPSENGNEKLLLAARRIRRTTRTEFIISLPLVQDNFSSNIGKLKSNFVGTKFTVYDTKLNSRSGKEGLFRTKKKLPPRSHPTSSNKIATVSYEFNLLRTRGPRRMQCVINSIPISSIQEGGIAPTPTSLSDHDLNDDEKKPSSSSSSEEPLMLRNKLPRWHEQLQCWCLNFKGRVTVASVKNFQLSVAVDSSLPNVPLSEKEKVILQFGKIGKDIFTMDYSYPLSAFQAFAICLSSFDTKSVCD
ncbi:tubby-like F-box protein 2 [Impatiens glandulifera]|uniref:tubby-like F-box protein 2 n=1 Tax=Impatiens glandulifera TaxID=253017 RepID=UPI001FB1068F|nr:tubby-like F-box protein 2 [Impatiens glandulifera]